MGFTPRNNREWTGPLLLLIGAHFAELSQLHLKPCCLVIWGHGVGSFLAFQHSAQRDECSSLIGMFLWTKSKMLCEPPENRPCQKESSLPTIHFQVRTVSFREGNILPRVYLILSVQKSVSTSVESQEKKLVRSVLGGGFKQFLCSPLGRWSNLSVSDDWKVRPSVQTAICLMEGRCFVMLHPYVEKWMHVYASFANGLKAMTMFICVYMWKIRRYILFDRYVHDVHILSEIYIPYVAYVADAQNFRCFSCFPHLLNVFL